MSLKALADQWLERNAYRYGADTKPEKGRIATPSENESERYDPSGDISGVERSDIPVQADPVPTSEPSPVQGRPVLPSPVRPAVPSPTPSADVPTVDVRAAVRLVLSHCRAVKDQGVYDFVDTHPQTWGQWADEVNGMREMLSETSPGTDSGTVDCLAAESVYWFIRLQMKLIDGDTYRERLHGPGGIWDRLRKGVKA